jgi:predicted nucleic-acid-binding Zn-ribbon protein
MKSETPVLRYACPKCGGKKYKISEIRVAYNLFTQLFDIQAAKYTALICEKCKYTEFYNLPAKSIKDAFDFSTVRG